MSFYHIAQLAAFAIAAFLAWKTPRAPLWVLLLASSYVISVLYLHFAPKGGLWPPSQIVGLFLDGLVLLAVREFHREMWEWQGLRTILILMVTADVIQLSAVLAGFPPPLSRESFGILLEVLNYLALLLVGGVGLMDRMPSDVRDRVGYHRIGILHHASPHRYSEQEDAKSLRRW